MEVDARWVTHVCCPSSSPLDGPFSVRISGSHFGTRVGVSRSDETGIGAHMRVTRTHTRVTRDATVRFFAETQRIRGISGRPRPSSTRLAHVSDSFDDLVLAVEQRVCLYAAVLSLLETNAVFHVDTSQLEQPFVIFTTRPSARLRK